MFRKSKRRNVSLTFILGQFLSNKTEPTSVNKPTSVSLILLTLTLTYPNLTQTFILEVMHLLLEFKGLLRGLAWSCDQGLLVQSCAAAQGAPLSSDVGAAGSNPNPV